MCYSVAGSVIYTWSLEVGPIAFGTMARASLSSSHSGRELIAEQAAHLIADEKQRERVKDDCPIIPFEGMPTFPIRPDLRGFYHLLIAPQSGVKPF